MDAAAGGRATRICSPALLLGVTYGPYVLLLCSLYLSLLFLSCVLLLLLDKAEDKDGLVMSA